MKTTLLVGAAVCALALPVSRAVAQPVPVVMCQIGSTFGPTVPERVCKALMNGARELLNYSLFTSEPSTMHNQPAGWRQPECTQTILRSLGFSNTSMTNVYYGSAVTICGDVLQSLENDYLFRTARGD